MTGALVWSQVRRAGAGLLATPLVIAIIVVVVGLVSASKWTPVQSATLLSWLGQILPIAAGIVVAVAVAGDQLVEFHESTPTSFRRVQVLRAAAALTGGVIASCVMFAPLHVVGVWPRDVGWVSLLVPGGAVVFLGAVAWTTASFSGALSTTTIAVVAAWMFLVMLWDPYVLPLYLQRGIPLLVAAGLFALSWIRLGNAEQNLAVAVTA